MKKLFVIITLNLIFSFKIFPVDLKINANNENLKADSPTYVVKKTSEEVREILNNEKDETLTHKKIKDTVANFFDYSLLSRLSLDKHWKRLSEAQKDEFINSFKKVLENSYAKKTGNFLGEINLNFTKEDIQDLNAVVYCVIKQKEVDISVQYKLNKTDNAWKVYDVIIDGSSLIENYKNQFNKYIRNKSLIALLDAMKKKADL